MPRFEQILRLEKPPARHHQLLLHGQEHVPADYPGQGSVDKENDEKMKTVLMGIRSKVKAKLEVRFRNGEISRVTMAALEEDLVKELKEELEEEFKG